MKTRRNPTRAATLVSPETAARPTLASPIAGNAYCNSETTSLTIPSKIRKLPTPPNILLDSIAKTFTALMIDYVRIKG